MTRPIVTGQADAGRARWRRLALAASVAAVVVVADQVTKDLAVDHLATAPVHLFGPVGLVLEYNTGVAFSLGAGSGWPVALAAAGLVAVLLALARSARSRAASTALGLVLGGALGNLADRLVGGHHGAVVDFVHVGAWPTFNLADAAVVVGCVLLAVHLLRRQPASRAPRSTDTATGTGTATATDAGTGSATGTGSGTGTCADAGGGVQGGPGAGQPPSAPGADRTRAEVGRR